MASEENIGKLYRIAQLDNDEIIEYANFRETLLRSIDKELDVDQVMIKMLEVSEGQSLGTYKNGVFIFSTDVMKSAEKLVYEENRRIFGTEENEITNQNESVVLEPNNITKEQLDNLVENFAKLDRKQRAVVLDSFDILSTEQQFKVADNVIEDLKSVCSNVELPPEVREEVESIQAATEYEKRRIELSKKLNDDTLSTEEKEALLPELIEMSRIELFDKIKEYESAETQEERDTIIADMVEMTGLDKNEVVKRFLSASIDLSEQVDKYLREKATMYLYEINANENTALFDGGTYDTGLDKNGELTRYIGYTTPSETAAPNAAKKRIVGSKSNFDTIIGYTGSRLGGIIKYADAAAEIVERDGANADFGSIKVSGQLKNASRFINGSSLSFRGPKIVSPVVDTVKAPLIQGKEDAEFIGSNDVEIYMALAAEEMYVDTESSKENTHSAIADRFYISGNDEAKKRTTAIEEKAKAIVDKSSHINQVETAEIHEIRSDKIEKRMDEVRENLLAKETVGSRIKRGLFNLKQKVTSFIDKVKGGESRNTEDVNDTGTSSNDTTNGSSTSSTTGPSVDNKVIQVPVDYLNTKYKLNFKQAAESAKAAVESNKEITTEDPIHDDELM